MNEPASKVKPAGYTRAERVRRVAFTGAGALVGSALTLAGLHLEMEPWQAPTDP
jgi:hypothetical protein